MIEAESATAGQERVNTARDLTFAMYRETVLNQLSDVQQLAVACDAALRAIPMNGPAAGALAEALATAHADFRKTLMSMAHVRSAAGIA